MTMLTQGERCLYMAMELSAKDWKSDFPRGAVGGRDAGL